MLRQKSRSPTTVYGDQSDVSGRGALVDQGAVVGDRDLRGPVGPDVHTFKHRHGGTVGTKPAKGKRRSEDGSADAGKHQVASRHVARVRSLDAKLADLAIRNRDDRQLRVRQDRRALP